MEGGQFDNLPGKGKPLKLNNANPYEDPEWRLAHHVIHSSGFVLPWIEAWKAIEAELESARTALARTNEWRRERLANEGRTLLVDSEWKRAQESFRQKIGELNKRIFEYNLQAPSSQLQRPPLDLEQEFKRIDTL
jgi:DnaJ family protein C protein 28